MAATTPISCEVAPPPRNEEGRCLQLCTIAFIYSSSQHPLAQQGGFRPVKGSSIALDGWNSDINKANMKLHLKDTKVSSKHNFNHDFFTSPL